MTFRCLAAALSRRALLVCAILTLAPTIILHAQVRGLSYTISPIVEQIYFDANAGLENGTLYGGQLGLGFGRLIELEGLYLLNDEVSNDFSGISGISDATRDKIEELEGRDVRLRRYGGKLKINLPTSNVVPFATLGAGVLSFEPEHLNQTRTIYLALGGGVQFSVAGRYALTLSAQRFGYRYNLGAMFFDDLDLARAGLSDRSFNQTQIYNWALRAGLRIYAGGRAPGEETALDEALREQLSGGLRGLSLRLEPFGGRLNFDEELGFKNDQRMAGLFAGLNLGPFVGVRGFYWRGVEEGVFEFDRLQAYGGELRFELTSGQSLSPYLTFGGGQLDVLDGYVGNVATENLDATVPEDEPFIIAGAGAVLPLNESLSLNAGARNILLTREGADNVSEPSDVVSSWMFTAGLSFGFGGRRQGAGEAIRTEIDREDDEMRRELAAAEARIDSLARLIERIAEGDTEVVREARSLSQDVAIRDTLRRIPQTDRMVTLPLPEEGEIYIRFGEPGGVSIASVIGDAGAATALPEMAASRQALSAEQIEQIVSQTVREQLRAADEAAVSERDVARIERRIQDRLDALEDRLQARLDRRLTQLEADVQPTRVIVEEPDGIRTARDIEPAADRDFYPFMAFLAGEPNLGIVGVRLDPGRPILGPIELQPEIGIGFGAETYAYHLNLDAVYTADFVDRVVSGLRPYIGIGGGMLGFNEKPEDTPGVQFTVNARIGSEFVLRWGHLFLEYGNYDFFDYHRIAAGYRVRL